MQVKIPLYNKNPQTNVQLEQYGWNFIYTVYQYTV